MLRGVNGRHFGLWQDYCEAQIMTSSYAAYTHAAPPETHLGPGVSSADKPRVGSYSGSSFSASFDPDNVAIDQTPAYSGWVAVYHIIKIIIEICERLFGWTIW